MRYMVTGKILKRFTKWFPRYFSGIRRTFCGFSYGAYSKKYCLHGVYSWFLEKNAKVFAKFYLQYFKTKLDDLLDFPAGF